MAKETSGKLIVSIVSLVVVIIVAIIGGAMAYAKTDSKTEQNAESITKHEESISKGFTHLSDRHKEDMAEVTKEVEAIDRNKVEKEIFQMHIDADNEKFKASQQVIKDGFDRMDSRLKKIEEK